MIPWIYLKNTNAGTEDSANLRHDVLLCFCIISRAAFIWHIAADWKPGHPKYTANSAEIVGRGENVRVSGSMIHYLGSLAQLELCWILTKGRLCNELHSCFGEGAKRFNISQAGKGDRAPNPPNNRAYGMTYVAVKGKGARTGALHGS